MTFLAGASPLARTARAAECTAQTFDMHDAMSPLHGYRCDGACDPVFAVGTLSRAVPGVPHDHFNVARAQEESQVREHLTSR